MDPSSLKTTLLDGWREYLQTEPDDAVELVDRLLSLVDQSPASDVHIYATESVVELRWRLDGVMAPLGTLPRGMATKLIGRLKVLASLLTYETSLPQEGRLVAGSTGSEYRLSTFPTLFGEQAVIRAIGTRRAGLQRLDDLGFSPWLLSKFRAALSATTGAVLVVGPAGSGKTTTAYAAVREVVATSGGGRAIHSLEDPVEVVVPGVVQSQVHAAAGFTMTKALKSLVRQDPEVLMLGEIRDRDTAATTLEAALTGSLVISTFHAGNTAEAIRRLIDMGIAPYAVQHAVRMVVAQRLVRRLCDCKMCGEPARDALPLGLHVTHCMRPVGCARCVGHWISWSCSYCRGGD